jgi:uncharacterized protein YbjT (DUF2867 family)
MAVFTVFGGTGFLGRRIVERLAADGGTVRVAVRHPPESSSAGSYGCIVPVQADIRDETTVEAAVAGVDGAINAVSAYVEKGGVTYAAVHEQGAAIVARQCARQRVSRLVHISGIGANTSSRSKYIRARGRGEILVQSAFPEATILRPSVMFGSDDAFLNTFAGLARRTPVFVLIGGGRTRLQPVHVADVADAVARVLREPSSPGRTYELGGPRIYTLREIVEAILRELQVRRTKASIPFWFARNLARLLQNLPSSPLTVAQVDLLQSDNVPRLDAPGLRDLAIKPRPMEDSIKRIASK